MQWLAAAIIIHYLSLQTYTGQSMHGVQVAAEADLTRLESMKQGIFARQNPSAAQQAMGFGQVVETLDMLTACDGSSATTKS